MLGSTRGYPYILERAHKYSSIGNNEKMSFIKAVGSYNISFKWMSKLK
jgi:NurA-like 5'-3' nuclease